MKGLQAGYSVPIDLHLSSRYRSSMDNPLYTYGPWREGKVQGCIEFRPASCVAHHNPTGLYLNFPYRAYVNGRTGAEAACHAFLYDYCKRNNLLKNEERDVTDPTTGSEWADVELTDGYVMQCDRRDLEFVHAYTWHTSTDPIHPRPRTTDEVTGLHIHFHNLITDWSMVDHIDRNSLNNRRANLRETTTSLNARNRIRAITNTSGITGVRKTSRGDAIRTHWPVLPGVTKSKDFSIKTYGEDKAWELAIALRLAKEKEFGITVHPRTDDPERPEAPRKRQRTKQ
jgi:hypothetical protein